MGNIPEEKAAGKNKTHFVFQNFCTKLVPYMR